ncbi:MAG TPA: hypothetical protein VGM90_12895 [Kofleriaceae bacterium]|jgi:hypothetical protein
MARSQPLTTKTFEGRAANTALELLPLVAVAVGVAAMIVAPVWFIGIPIALAGLPMWMFSWLKLTIDRENIVIAFGPFGFPRVRVPTSEVDRAEVIDVSPMRYGGWGYRGGLRLFKKAAAVIRKGEGLKLDLSGGRVLVITVDNAREALDVLHTLQPR